MTKAIPLNAEGQLSDTEIAWQYGKGTSYVTSNLLLGDYIYLLADNGILTCLDAATGAVVYEGGRVPLPTRFVASPVAFGSNIVLSGQDGDMFVVRAGPEHEVLGPTRWASRSGRRPRSPTAACTCAATGTCSRSAGASQSRR